MALPLTGGIATSLPILSLEVVTRPLVRGYTLQDFPDIKSPIFLQSSLLTIHLQELQSFPIVQIFSVQCIFFGDFQSFQDLMTLKGREVSWLQQSICPWTNDFHINLRNHVFLVWTVLRIPPLFCLTWLQTRLIWLENEPSLVL